MAGGLLDMLQSAFGGQAQPDPSQVAQQPQPPQSGGLLSGLGNSDFLDKLRDIGTGLSMGTTSNDAMSKAGMMLGQGNLERKQTRLTKDKANKTASWLQTAGVGAPEASYLASDPDALRAWYKEYSTGSKPQWEITDMYDSQGRKIKAMVDKKSGAYNQIGGAEQPDAVHQLTPEQALSMGLDPKKAYQQKTNGAISEIGGAGVTVNLPGASEIGTIPQGYEAYKDENGVRHMREIPGGPKDTAPSEAAKTDAAKIATDTLSNATKNITGLLGSGSFVTGSGGRLAANLSTSNAAELRRQVGVLKSTATIETLNAMRKQSPTGGALGNVTEGEGQMLAAKAGAIDPDSSAEQFQSQYKDYYKTLLRVINGSKDGDTIYDKMFSGSSAAPGAPAPQAAPAQGGVVPFTDYFK